MINTVVLIVTYQNGATSEILSFLQLLKCDDTPDIVLIDELQFVFIRPFRESILRMHRRAEVPYIFPAEIP
jgi:hypothetical protein